MNNNCWHPTFLRPDNQENWLTDGLLPHQPHLTSMALCPVVILADILTLKQGVVLISTLKLVTHLKAMQKPYKHRYTNTAKIVIGHF